MAILNVPETLKKNTNANFGLVMVLMQTVLCIYIDLDIIRKNKNRKYIYKPFSVQKDDMTCIPLCTHVFIQCTSGRAQQFQEQIVIVSKIKMQTIGKNLLIASNLSLLPSDRRCSYKSRAVAAHSVSPAQRNWFYSFSTVVVGMASCRAKCDQNLFLGCHI